MSSTEDKIKTLKVSDNLITFLQKLGVKNLDRVKLENQRKLTWMQMALMMEHLEHDMFGVSYPWQEIHEPDLPEEEDEEENPPISFRWF